MDTRLEVYDNENGILLARVEVMQGYTSIDFVQKMANSLVTVKNAKFASEPEKSSASAKPASSDSKSGKGKKG